MNLDILMSDEFVQFSKNVEALHNRKKELKAEFQALQAQFQQDVNAVNKEVQTLQAEFEAWQESKVKGAESFDILKAQKLQALENPPKKGE